MRASFRYFAACAVLLVAAACSEPIAGPRTSAKAVRASNRAPVFDVTAGRPFGFQSAGFTVTSEGGTFSVNGLFNVSFPANAVCDPDQSDYGDGTWDTPCVTLAPGQSIDVHAYLNLSGGGIGVDFQPALRFAPDAEVTLWTDIYAPTITANADYFSQNTSALRPLALYYIPALGAESISDYLSDPTLVTYVDLVTGRVSRRIKHFSGYNVTSGRACVVGDGEADCIQVKSAPEIDAPLP